MGKDIDFENKDFWRSTIQKSAAKLKILLNWIRHLSKNTILKKEKNIFTTIAVINTRTGNAKESLIWMKLIYTIYVKEKDNHAN